MNREVTDQNPQDKPQKDPAPSPNDALSILRLPNYEEYIRNLPDAELVELHRKLASWVEHLQNELLKSMQADHHHEPSLFLGQTRIKDFAAYRQEVIAPRQKIVEEEITRRKLSAN